METVPYMWSSHSEGPDLVSLLQVGSCLIIVQRIGEMRN